MKKTKIYGGAKYLKWCKDAIWQRWTGEYLRALRETHRLKQDSKVVYPKVSDVMLIKSDQKDRGKWKMGVIEKLFPGQDGVVRAVELKVGTSRLQRPIQHLYPFELSCDPPLQKKESQLNHEAQEFRPRSVRSSAQAAKERISAIARMEECQ